MNESNVVDRVTELEFQLTHHQRIFEQLNEVVIEQGSKIDILERELLKLRHQLENLKAESQSSPNDPRDEKPPHY